MTPLSVILSRIGILKGFVSSLGGMGSESRMSRNDYPSYQLHLSVLVLKLSPVIPATGTQNKSSFLYPH